MKILNILVLLASLFAIAGAAFFRIFVLLANALFTQPVHHRYSSWLG